jgi:MATE family multidrug resistance protein
LKDDDYNSQEASIEVEDELYYQKMKIVIRQAVPSLLCMLILMIQEMINLIFVGHLNNSAMIAGVGTGNMIQNMFGLSMFVGLNGALETLVSQSYGSGNLKLCGVYLNRGRFILLCSFVPVAMILLNA